MPKWTVKIILTCLFNINGIIRYEFVPMKQTVSQAFYLNVLERSWRRISQKKTRSMAGQVDFFTTLRLPTKQSW
jgi:uncharacterized membrane protein